jgi:hypothetical protein
MGNKGSGNNGTTDGTISALSNRDPGEDHKDPYENKDISDLSEWWQELIEEHEEHSLRPYRPPRFSDGVLMPALTKELENELDINITVIGIDSQHPNQWIIRVDGEKVTELKRERSPDGYSQLNISSDEYKTLIRKDTTENT